MDLPERWRVRAAGAAFTSSLALGFQDALEPVRHHDPVVIPEPGEEPPADGIVLYFHPQVPEATLVLITPRRRRR